MAVFATFYLFRLCCATRTIKFRELCFITYAGMIRGAIAFALVLKIPYINTTDPTKVDTCPAALINPNETSSCFSEKAYNTLVSTTLILVMLTTIIFGTFMGKVQKLLVPATKEDKEEYLEERRN